MVATAGWWGRARLALEPARTNGHAVRLTTMVDARRATTSGVEAINYLYGFDQGGEGND